MKDQTTAFFEDLGERGHEPLLRKATGTVRFDFTDGKKTEHWLVTIKKGDVAVSQEHRKADCVLAANRALANGIFSGDVNAMAALLRGELSTEGDPELLVLFQRAFPGPAASIERRDAALARRS